MNASVSHDVLRRPCAVGEPIRMVVQANRLQAEGIHAFELVHEEGFELPEIEAGAHVDVHLPGGMVRSYSLAGNPKNRSHWTLGVLRETNGRGGSRAMHESVPVGSRLQIGWPRNAFKLAEGATHSILIAGGIGITPLKAMAHELAERKESFELHYCARTVKHAAFSEELRQLVPAGRLHMHHDGGERGRGLDIAELLGEVAPGTHVYFCGPGGFMDACAAASRHWPDGTVHCEHFKAPEREPSADRPSGSFEVKMARTGAMVQVLPDQTIVRALELAGHRIPTSCLSGLCGACKVSYLEGDVEHNDFILTEEERGHCMTACVSRAKTDTLVLDI